MARSSDRDSSGNPFAWGSPAGPANPPAAIVEAVDRGDIDAAAVWGPLAGYFASRARHPMSVEPVPNETPQAAPMTFDIAMGVRDKDKKLLESVNGGLGSERPDIARILAAYHVPP